MTGLLFRCKSIVSRKNSFNNDITPSAEGTLKFFKYTGMPRPAEERYSTHRFFTYFLYYCNDHYQTTGNIGFNHQ